MAKWPWRRQAGSSHVRDEDLLLFVDGELSGAHRDRIRSHLESCWTCRARRQHMELAISEYVAADRALVDTTPPPKLWREFDARLNERIARGGEPAAIAPAGGMRFGWRAATAGALMLGFLTAATFVISSRLNESAKPEPRTAQRQIPNPHPRSPEPVRPALRAVSEPPHTTSAITPESLTRTAVEIEFALHQVGACLGGEVRAQRNDGRLRVYGVVDTAERRKQIVAALGALLSAPGVTHDLRMPSQAASGKAPAVADTPLRAEDNDRLEADAIPAEARLRRFVEKHPDGRNPALAMAQLSRGAVASSAAAMRHAWAARWLAEQYGAERLSADSQTRIDAMVRDHLTAVRLELAHGRELVASVFYDMSPAAEPPPEDSPLHWPESVMVIFRHTEACERMIASLFTADPTSRDARRPEDVAEQFLSVEAALVRDCLSLDRQLAARLSARGTVRN